MTQSLFFCYHTYTFSSICLLDAMLKLQPVIKQAAERPVVPIFRGSQMSNIELDNTEARDKQKLLLQEFDQIARRTARPTGLTAIRISRGMWISLKMTNLLQRLGYNKRKLANLEREKPLILNIGCGSVKDSSMINADLFPYYLPILEQIILGLKFLVNPFWGDKNLVFYLLINLPYYDLHLSNCADGIVLSHVLEHLPPTLVINALRNCLDYLKPGGCIRVSVPYLGAYDLASLPPSQGVKNRMLAKNSVIYGWEHQFMYDAELLTALMEKAGFSYVKEVAFQEGLLHQTDLKSRQPESIYLTGLKT